MGCLPGPVSLPGVGGDAYEKQLFQWTRKIEVYRRFEAKIFVTATYHAPEFRKAYIQKRTAILELPENVRLQEEEQQRRLSDSFHEFFLAVYTSNRRWNDLDEKDSIWRLSLQNDRQERVSPHEVVRVDRQNAEVMAFYPYLDGFRQAYLVRFPKTSLELNTPLIDETVRSFKLVISSSIAVAELSWGLDST